MKVGVPLRESCLTPSPARTHDRLCTVSRTIEIGTPVAASIADDGAAHS
jgi:hypothetical protein